MKLNISWRLYLLCGSLIAFMLVISGLGFYGMKGMQGKLHRVAGTELPAVKNMVLADMMHDGLRGTVYRGIIFSGSKDEKEIQSIRDEFTEMARNFELYLDTIDQLDLHGDTKTAIQDARPAVMAYIKAGGEVLQLALKGETEAAIAGLQTFNSQFENLEEKLGVLSERIEADAGEEKSAGDSTLVTILVITAFFVVAGSAGCLIIVRSLKLTLRESVDQLIEENDSIYGRAKDANGISSTLGDAASTQSSALQQTAASLEQLKAMVEKSAAGAQQSKEAAELSEAVARQGKVSTDQMVAAFEAISESNARIMEQVETNNEQIFAMGRKIQEIGEKTKVINDIVFQTKLLSFNASVEAARAGEQGKGFAVVAEEVGNLAEMSGSAAKEIADMLKESIEWVNGVAAQSRAQVEGLVTTSRSKLDAGLGAVKNCDSVLVEMLEKARSMTEYNASISVACREQAQGVSEITEAMNTLVQINLKTTDLSEQANSCATELSERAGSLSNLVEKLKSVIGYEPAAGARSVKTVTPAGAARSALNKAA